MRELDASVACAIRVSFFNGRRGRRPCKILDGTYALNFRCFHALAGSHDAGFRAARVWSRFTIARPREGNQSMPLAYLDRRPAVGDGIAAGWRLGVSESSSAETISDCRG